jgi:hypothetical protein
MPEVETHPIAGGKASGTVTALRADGSCDPRESGVPRIAVRVVAIAAWKAAETDSNRIPKIRTVTPRPEGSSLAPARIPACSCKRS